MPRHGENIWKRKDGRWEARYIKDRDETGKAIYGYAYGKTYSAAKQKRNEKMMERKAAPTYMGPMAFTALTETFLNQQRYLVKESTYVHYLDMIELHIGPFFGDMESAKITNAAIEQFVSEKLQRGRLDGKGGLSPKTVKDLAVLLKHILKYGVEKQYIPDHGLSVVGPKVVKPNIEILTHHEQCKLEALIGAEEDLCCFGILLCLYTGLRIGELCALMWSDFDFEKGTLQVCRTIQRVKNTDAKDGAKTKIIIERPKTNASIRLIPLPSFLAAKLQRRRRGQEGTPFDYVLTGSKRYIEPRNYYARYQRILKRCGIGKHTFHALRHTFATRCVECGFDAKSLSEILGHTDVKITLERYVHPSLDLKRGYMEQLKLHG